MSIHQIPKCHWVNFADRQNLQHNDLLRHILPNFCGSLTAHTYTDQTRPDWFCLLVTHSHLLGHGEPQALQMWWIECCTQCSQLQVLSPAAPPAPLSLGNTTEKWVIPYRWSMRSLWLYMLGLPVLPERWVQTDLAFSVSFFHSVFLLFFLPSPLTSLSLHLWPFFGGFSVGYQACKRTVCYLGE